MVFPKFPLLPTVKYSIVGTATCCWLVSGDQILMGARFSTPVHTGVGALAASCIMGTGVSFLEAK
jgi:hypothetical protein